MLNRCLRRVVVVGRGEGMLLILAVLYQVTFELKLFFDNEI